MVKYESVEDKAISDELVRKAKVLKKRPLHLLNVNFAMVAALGGVIIMPLVLAIWLGSYLDEVYPQRFSWIVSLLFVGFCWGGFNAYWWLKTENDKIERLTELENTKKNSKERGEQKK